VGIVAIAVCSIFGEIGREIGVSSILGEIGREIGVSSILGAIGREIGVSSILGEVGREIGSSVGCANHQAAPFHGRWHSGGWLAVAVLLQGVACCFRVRRLPLRISLRHIVERGRGRDAGKAVTLLRSRPPPQPAPEHCRQK
jgi:hypothetical protein